MSKAGDEQKFWLGFRDIKKMIGHHPAKSDEEFVRWSDDVRGRRMWEPPEHWMGLI